MEEIIAKLENDIRNELHSIMGLLELIAQGPLTPAQSDNLRACKGSADRLLGSVRNVSAFLSAESDEVQISVFDLHGLIADLRDLMDTLARLKGLSLRCELQPEVPRHVAGDHDRLQDILFRLLDNAIKFSDHGQVRLVVAVDPRNSTGLEIQFEVLDSGSGIPSDVVARLSGPLSEQPASKGLGLPIVHKLVLGMGGSFTIGSNEGGGSRVVVSLPFVRAIGDAPFLADLVGAVQPLKILVAEDSDDTFYVLESFLKEQKHRLTRSVDGTRAVEIFKAGHYDLVLMDIHMPGQDGYSATRAIREFETSCARARVPILVLSSDSPSTQTQNGAKVGCSGYLTKPVSRVALLSAIERYAIPHFPRYDSGIPNASVN